MPAFKHKKFSLKKAKKKCFLFVGNSLQYPCIKLAGVATFGKPRIFEKKSKKLPRYVCRH